MSIVNPTTYPGQCRHIWRRDPSRPPGCEKCLAPGCHAICTRGKDGLIDTYDSGIRETPYFKRFEMEGHEAAESPAQPAAHEVAA